MSSSITSTAESSSFTTTPEMAPASQPSDENGASLSFDEAKTQFLRVIAKLKPLHVSMFFHWLQLQINTHTLNGLPSISLPGSTDSTSSTLLTTSPSCSSTSSSSSLTALSFLSGASPSSTALASSARSLCSLSASSPLRTIPSFTPVRLPQANDFVASSTSSSSTAASSSLPSLSISTALSNENPLVAEKTNPQKLKMDAKFYQPNNSSYDQISAASQGFQGLLDSRGRRQLERKILHNSTLPHRLPSLIGDLPDPKTSRRPSSPNQDSRDDSFNPDRPMSVPPFHRIVSAPPSHRPVSVPPSGFRAASNPSHRHVTSKSTDGDGVAVTSPTPCSPSATLKTGYRLPTMACTPTLLPSFFSTTSTINTTDSTNLTTPTFTTAEQRLSLPSPTQLPVAMTTRAHSTEISRNQSSPAACSTVDDSQVSSSGKTTTALILPSSPTNVGSDVPFGNVSNAQQQIQQLLRHQHQMFGNQSILRTQLQYYQMHHLHQLYDPRTIGVNGLLPPFPSLLPTHGVPVASSSLAHQIVAPNSLLTSNTPLIAVSTPVPAPPMSPALSSPMPMISDSSLITTTSINNNIIMTYNPIIAKMSHLKRELLIERESSLPSPIFHFEENKNNVKPDNAAKSLGSVAAVVKVEVEPNKSHSSLIPNIDKTSSVDVRNSLASIDDGAPSKTFNSDKILELNRDDLKSNLEHIKCRKNSPKRLLKHKSKHKYDRKRRRERRHKDRNRSKSCSSSVSSSTSDGGSEVGVSPLKRKFKMSPRHSKGSCNSELPPGTAATAAAPSASAKKYFALRDSGNYDDENGHRDYDDVEKGDANKFIGPEGGKTFLAKDEITSRERKTGGAAHAPMGKNGASITEEDDYEEGELVITEDMPSVEDRISDEDDVVVDVDSVDDVDPRDRSLILKLNAAMEAGDAAALSRTLTTVDDRKCIVEYSLAHGEDAAEDKFGVHRKMISRWKKEVEVMNAVNPTLRTRYYKELTRRRKQLDGDFDGDFYDDDDFEDDVDGLRRNDLPQDRIPKSISKSRERLHETVAESSKTRLGSCSDRLGPAVPESASSRSGGGLSGTVFTSPASPPLTSSSKLNHSDDGLEDGGVGLSMDSNGVFLGTEALGTIDLDCVAESGSGGGTKMYTPAQKKAIVEYAVQYGERAAAKKFGVHRKNIYRWKRNHNLMAKTSIKRPSGPRLSLNGDPADVGGDPASASSVDIPPPALISAPVSVAATSTIAIGGGWVFPSPMTAQHQLHPQQQSLQQSDRHLIAPQPSLPPLLPPPHLRPEQNTLTIEVIKTNSSALSPALQGHYLNFYNSHCNVPMGSPSTPPPPPSSSSTFVPPLPPLAHHLPSQPVPKPQSSNFNIKIDSIIPKNNNNNEPELWETLKDVKPDLRNLSEEVTRDRRHVGGESAMESFLGSPKPEDIFARNEDDVTNSVRRDGENRKGVASSPSTTGVLVPPSLPAEISPKAADSDAALESTDLRPKKRKRKNSGRTV